MLFFARLRPFVSFFQGCGFIPFEMEIERFARFTFSFKHIVTWWFLIQFMLQLGLTVEFFYSTAKIGNALIYSYQDSSLIETLILVIVIGSHLLQFATGRLILINYKRLQIASEAIQDAEAILKTKTHRHTIVNDDNLIRKRFVLHVVFVCIWVSVSLANAFLTLIEN